MLENINTLSSLSSSISPQNNETQSEEGDSVINLNLQYCSNLFFQSEIQLRSALSLIKTELIKIKIDGDFVKSLPGTHHHLSLLKTTDRDLRSSLNKVNELIDLFTSIGHRAAQRII